jgi:hypothetical protein
MVNGQWSIDHSQLTTHHSQIIPGVTLRRPDIFPDISPECKNHVNDDGRAHCQDGCIYKILPDPAGSDPHPVTDSRTNAKGIPFYEAFKSVHTSNVENCTKTSNKAY